MNLPNFLSFSRIFLIIPIILFFELDYYFYSFIFFVIASLTDYFDGYFARKNNQTSESGALLDLLADKLFVSIILLWMTYSFNHVLILISSMMIISREIIISYVRLFLVSKKKELKDFKSDLLGKIKTTLQMISLGIILISPVITNLFFRISVILLILTAALSWFSLIRYLNKWIIKKD